MNEADIRRILKQEAERFESEKDKPDSGKYVTPRPASEPSQVYSVRIPVSRLEELRALAAREGKPPSSMIRDWVLERLEAQLSREGRSIPAPISIIENYIVRSPSRDMGISRQSRPAYERTIRNEIDRIKTHTRTISERLHKGSPTRSQPSSTSTQG
jgi:hypothetical protein